MLSVLLIHIIKYEFNDFIIIYKCEVDYINYIKILIIYLLFYLLFDNSLYIEHDRVYKFNRMRE